MQSGSIQLSVLYFYFYYYIRRMNQPIILYRLVELEVVQICTDPYVFILHIVRYGVRYGVRESSFRHFLLLGEFPPPVIGVSFGAKVFLEF